jgi:hypothetical protein
MAKAIIRETPARGFAEVPPAAAGAPAGASGPIVGAAIKAPAFDTLTGLSLSFDATGYQRFWVNKTAGGVIGIIGVDLPADLPASTFLNDFDKWAKLNNGRTTTLQDIAGAKQATLTIDQSTVSELAFTIGNRGYLVVGSGATVSAATVAETARRQQGFALSQTARAAAPANSSAAPTEPAKESAAATATGADATTADTSAFVPERRDTMGKLFLRSWLRLGAASLVFLGVGALIMRLGAPYKQAAAQAQAQAQATTRPQPTLAYEAQGFFAPQSLLVALPAAAPAVAPTRSALNAGVPANAPLPFG